MGTFWKVAGVLAALFFVAALFVQREKCAWIDAISGSQKEQVNWPLAITTSRRASESQIAARYRALGLRWEADWRLVEGTSTNLLGVVFARGHAPTPEIYSLATTEQLQRAFLSAATDDEVRAFFNAMASGSSAEMKAAAEAAEAKALAAMGAK